MVIIQYEQCCSRDLVHCKWKLWLCKQKFTISTINIISTRKGCRRQTNRAYKIKLHITILLLLQILPKYQFQHCADIHNYQITGSNYTFNLATNSGHAPNFRHITKLNRINLQLVNFQQFKSQFYFFSQSNFPPPY